MKQAIFSMIWGTAFLLSCTDSGSGPIVSQNGISTYQLAEEILFKYDSNKDGLLSPIDETFLRTSSSGLVLVESRGLLFYDADKYGNDDGFVTLLELENFLEQFDTDNDGEITTYKNIIHSITQGGSEWAAFDSLYTEKYKYEEN